MSKSKAFQAQPDVNAALSKKSTASVESDIKARIGQQLRAMYRDVVNQGVPDRFSEILRRLEGTDRKNENEGSNGPRE
jgi:hypothetical protein